jgi:glc operon protein GlcG
MRKTIVAAAAAVLLLSPVVVQAQTPVPAAPPPAPPYGLSIGAEATKKALAAAEAEAKKNNWAVAIAVVDTGGKLTGFTRLDNVQNASVDIAIGKAVTANNFKRPTKALQDGIAQGGVNLRILGQPGVTPLEGGVPIVVDGKIIGAIGVSGVLSSQDAECAMAGAAAAK